MKYRLTVHQIEQFTPEQMEQIARSRGRAPFYNDEPGPTENVRRVLEVELTETEWQAAKKAVIETM